MVLSDWHVYVSASSLLSSKQKLKVDSALLQVERPVIRQVSQAEFPGCIFTARMLTYNELAKTETSVFW